jgi:two-component sensor histidine kinase
MKHLEQHKLFILKKLLLETDKSSRNYGLADFLYEIPNKKSDFDYKEILEYLIKLVKNDFIKIDNIKVKREFFEQSLSNFIEVDFNEKGRPAYADISMNKVKETDYIGLGNYLFNKYIKECCFDSISILEPDTDLDITIKELENIIPSLSKLQPYSKDLSLNLEFEISTAKKQQDKVKKFIDKYLLEFMNDNLEIESATEYYRYSKQKEMLQTTITRLGRDYPVKNLWLTEDSINLYGQGDKVVIIGWPLENFNFLETALCLEQENKNGRKIKIEALDKEKGIRITDYSSKKLPNNQTNPHSSNYDNQSLKKISRARAEEIRKRFEELDERQKELEELGKQISYRVLNNFNIPSQYLKYYKEVSKKASEQLAPIKEVLEKFKTSESTFVNLTPAIQRLATPIKQIEEQMKKLNKISIPSNLSQDFEITTSPKIRQIEQETQIASDIRDIKTLIQGLLTGNDRKKQRPIPLKITEMPEVVIKKKNKPTTKYIPKKDNLLFTKNLKADISIGKLSAYNDGTIRYGKRILEMRNQLKDLCRFFMKNQNRMLTIDDIKDEIIRADRRTIISFTTIAKYVSELHNLLKTHFGKDIIFNQKEEGWYFKPPK